MSAPVTEVLIALLGPAAVALLMAALPWVRHRGAPAAALTILGSVLSTGLAVKLLLAQMAGAPVIEYTASWLNSGGASAAEVGVRLDGASAPMLVVVCFVALCVQLFSIGYMHDEDGPGFGRYFTLHALFLFSMNTLVVAPNLLQLFAGWELVGVTSYLLIGFWFKKPSAARAAVKAFWVTKFADMGFMVGLFVLFATTGSFGWTQKLEPETATVVTLLLFLAVVGKSAQFPLHVWLPDAMEGPTPVSALLHAATMVAAGVFLIVRANPLFEQSETTREVMMIVGSSTALFAALLALVQKDIKKVLAYSTCSQLGYMVAALGAGSLMGGFFHLTTHAFFKALLFLAAGSAIHAVHSNSLADMGGLRKKMPITTFAFVVGALALAGIPGLSGFFSKDLVLGAIEGKLGWVPWTALLVAAFLTAFYMGRVIALAFLGPTGEHSEHAHEGGASMTGPLVALSLLAISVGWLASPFAHLLGEEYHLHLAGVTPISASLAGILGMLIGLRFYSTHRSVEPDGAVAIIGQLDESSAMNRLWEALFRRGMLRVSAIFGWFDRYVVDGLINAIGEWTIRAGRGLRPMQTGVASDYVLAALVGAIVLAIWGVWG